MYQIFKQPADSIFILYIYALYLHLYLNHLANILKIFFWISHQILCSSSNIFVKDIWCIFRFIFACFPRFFIKFCSNVLLCISSHFVSNMQSHFLTDIDSNIFHLFFSVLFADTCGFLVPNIFQIYLRSVCGYIYIYLSQYFHPIFLSYTCSNKVEYFKYFNQMFY